MLHPPNFLRVYRKRSPLTQSDIARLMKLPDYSNISRCEKGQRSPSIELLLVYHLIFNISIESFFEYHANIALSGLLEQIEPVISEIKKEGINPKANSRIKFLEELLIRLTQ